MSAIAKDANALTDEQRHVVELMCSGQDTKVIAGAGVGKTRVVVAGAQELSRQGARGLAVVFNRKNADELKERLAGTRFRGMTFHGLAYRSTGKLFQPRLERRDRMFQEQVAAALGITRTLKVPLRMGSVGRVDIVRPRDQVELVLDAVQRFTQSEDEQLDHTHFERRPGLADDDWDLVLSRLMLPARNLWLDLCNPDGLFPFQHDHYLRLYLDHLRSGRARDRYDVVLVDEMQDVSACKFAIAELIGEQLIGVGDTNQSLYGFNGAVDYLASERTADWLEGRLTGSFRFGPAIADVANSVLAYLPTDMTVRGLSPIHGLVGPLQVPNAILCRSNKGVMIATLSALLRGRKTHVIGGVDELIAFAQGSMELQANGQTYQPDLRYFSSWAQAIAASQEEAMFRDLELVLQLVDELTPQRVLLELTKVTSTPEFADVTVSTAHRFKGLEALDVQLGADYESVPSSPEEIRVIYVAVTRAQRSLDVSAAPCFVGNRFVPGGVNTSTHHDLDDPMAWD